jgi:hypothetical protein
VPVVWNDESLIFGLDTGAARAGFDSSLKSRLGDPVGRTTLQTSTGLIDTEEFACPVATVAAERVNKVAMEHSLESVSRDGAIKQFLRSSNPTSFHFAST